MYKPKWHFARRIPDNIGPFLLDTFVCERKHSLVKHVADQVKNTHAFERTVLSRTLLEHERQLKGSIHFTDCLLGAAASPELAQATGSSTASISLEMIWAGTRVAKGDVVIVDNNFTFDVKGCGCFDGCLGLLVHECVRSERVGSIAFRCMPSGVLSCLKLRGTMQLRLPAMWTREEDGHVLVIQAM